MSLPVPPGPSAAPADRPLGAARWQATAWRAYLILGVAASLGYFLPASLVVRNIWFDALNLTAPLAILLGLALHRPHQRWPWVLLCAGTLLSSVGDVVWSSYDLVLHLDAPVPSVADVLYLGGHGLVVMGLWQMICLRRQDHDLPGLLDATVIATGGGLLAWVFLMAPYVQDTALSLRTVAVSLLYPILDVLMLALLARLWFAAGHRHLAFRALSAFLGLWFIADMLYAFLVLQGQYTIGSAVDLGWLLGTTALGVAALHPSMRTLATPGPTPTPHLTRGRLLLLTTAALLAPATLAVEVLRGQTVDLWVIVGASALLFVLVILRMAGLLQVLTATTTRLGLELAERTRAEQALRVSEERLRSLLDLAPDGIAVFDDQGRCVQANHRAATLLGYPLDELEGAMLWDLVTAAERSTVRSQLGTLPSGAAGSSERRLVRKDGTPFPAEINSVMLPGRLLQVIFRDTTARTAAAQQLQQAKAEAERATVAKSTFLSHMSHELRTPLNAILGFAQIMAMDALSAKQAERTGYILTAGQQLLQLINEVLDTARVESGHVAVTLAPVALEEVVPAACALIAPLATDHGIGLDVALATLGGRQVLADRQRLMQVLLNLLANAIKYNRPGGYVAVTCSLRPSGRLRLAVRDTGPGIAADALAKLFTPFERLSAAASAVEGTGLGLVMAQGLMAAQHGTLGVESKAGEGSTFWIELPQAAAPAAQREARA